jgi:predicted nucleic acid-binding Zn ribbon protein
VSGSRPRLLKELGLDEEVWEMTLAREWEALVGPQVAAHTRPGPVRYRTLTVFVVHSVWLHELGRFGARKQLLANLQERFGRHRIRDLRLALDPDPK